MTRGAALVATAGLTGVGYAGLQWLGRTYGSTREERRRAMPGDDLCVDPQPPAPEAGVGRGFLRRADRPRGLHNVPADAAGRKGAGGGNHRAGSHRARLTNRADDTARCARMACWDP
jgi:hypothetical protein